MFKHITWRRSQSVLQKNASDCKSIYQTLEGCVDPLDTHSHSEGQLVNICTEYITDCDANIQNAVIIRTNQLDYRKLNEYLW